MEAVGGEAGEAAQGVPDEQPAAASTAGCAQSAQCAFQEAPGVSVSHRVQSVVLPHAKLRRRDSAYTL